MTKADFYTDDEIAELLGIKKSTLMKNRSLGRNHPPYVRIGKYARYPKKEADAWIRALPVRREIKAS